MIKGYTEKQWGRKATELPSFIIRRLPVRYTFDNNYFNHRYQGVPVDGYTAIFDKMLDSELIDVQVNTDFFSHKEEYLAEFPKIVYTGMIDQYFNYELGELEYRSVRFESETFETDNKQGNAVINYTDAETPFTRVMEWRHFDKKVMKIKQSSLRNILKIGIVRRKLITLSMIRKTRNSLRNIVN